MLLPSLFVLAGEDEGLKEVAVKMDSCLKYNASASIVVGPARCGKTSLLFQFAYNSAALGQRVWFVCREKKIHTDFARFQINYQPSPDTLRHLNIK